MRIFRYRVEADSWICSSSDKDDERLKLSLFRTIQKDSKKTIATEDYYKYFELGDEKNVVAKYMSEHHDEIRSMVSPGGFVKEHERFTLKSVLVKEDGSIALAFLDNGELCLDTVTMKRGDCPCFRLTCGDSIRKYEISVISEGSIHRTVVEEGNRILKYGYKGSTPIIDVEEHWS